MMGRQSAPVQLFYDFRLDDHVPANHLLRQIDVFVDLERSLDHYLAGIDQLPKSMIAEDYRFLRTYYFMHNDDPEREAPFIRALAGRGE